MGNTPSQEQKDINLSLAAEKGEVIKVDQLLKDGADPNKPLKDGERLKRNSLHRAAKTKNNVDVLTKLLSYIKDVGKDLKFCRTLHGQQSGIIPTIKYSCFFTFSGSYNDSVEKKSYPT